MYYRKISKERKRRLRAVRVLVLGLLLLLAVFGTDRKIRPIIRDNAAIQTKAIAVKALNEAVIQTLEQTDSTYNNLVNLEKGNDGKVVSVQTNAPAVSQVQSALTQAVMECLEKLQNSKFEMRLGTLLSPEYFSGHGPKFRFQLEPSGYVTTKIVSTFSSAGINQTQHKILFQISVPISGAIPGYHSEAIISTDFLLADTVIVGSIPEYYTNVVTEDKNMVGELNDYSPDMPEKN